MSDIADRVKKIVVEHLGVEEEKVTETASFIDDLGADSLDTVELDIGNISARLSGAMALREVEDGLWLPDLQLSGPIGGRIGPREVLAYWPIELADGARIWIDEHVIAGEVRNARLELDLNAESIVEGVLPNDRLSLRFDFVDAAFHFISTMTPMTPVTRYRSASTAPTRRITASRLRIAWSSSRSRVMTLMEAGASLTCCSRPAAVTTTSPARRATAAALSMARERSPLILRFMMAGA